MIGIYKVVNPNGRVYVGQSMDVDRRWEDYKRVQGKGQPRLHRSIKKHGVVNHIFELIEECRDIELNVRERYWQDFFNVTGKKGLNCRLTGSNDRVGFLSEETKAKISKTHTGMKHSEETKQKISNINLGKKLSSETCRKMSIAKKGIVFTEEHLKNLRKPRRTLICPHCKREGGAAQMQQWHFDKCKNK
tara:strand:- start:42 stop:611 length:570 start_codon:yes stop_codon:yes gene_type:complete